MTTFALIVLASMALALWYRRFSERNARRAYVAYFRWVKRGNVG